MKQSFPHHFALVTLRTIDHGTFAAETDRMARYSAFLGRKVEVQYRAGDICLPASGMFVADSGRSIFLEQRFDQRGLERTFRWEVPYAYIIRIQELPSESVGNAPAFVAGAAEPVEDLAPESAELKAKGAAACSGGASEILPFSHHTNLA